MEILFGKIIMGMDDTEAKDEKGEPITLRKMAFLVLSMGFPDEQGLSGEDKFKRFELYLKIKNNPDPIDLTVEEIALLKKLIAKAYSPLFLGQAWVALENKQ